MNGDQQLIRDFVRKLTARYDRRYWLACASEGRHVDAMWRELGASGFLGATVGEAYGGSGPSLQRLTILVEELSKAGVPTLFLVVSAAMAALPLERHGTEAQRRRYLPELASGREKFCFALTEPDAGSNSFRLRMVARRDGAGYRLNGQKVFITGANDANHMLVVAATDEPGAPGKRARLSLFIVPLPSPGLTLKPMDVRILAPEKQFEVFFDDVAVGPDALVAERPTPRPARKQGNRPV